MADELRFAFFEFLYGANLGKELGAGKTKTWLEIQARIDRLSGPATKELQKDFRILLGYPSPDPTSDAIKVQALGEASARG